MFKHEKQLFHPVDKVRATIDFLLNREEAHNQMLYDIQTEKRRKVKGRKGSNIPCGPVFPYFFPLQIQNALNEVLHPGGAGLLHSLSEVTVAVQGKGGGSMAQIALDRLHIVPGPERIHGVCMAAVVEPHMLQPCGIRHGPEAAFHTPL